GQHCGWRWSFVVFGGLGILLGLVVNRTMIEPAKNVDELETVATGKEPAAAGRMPMFEFLRSLRKSPTVLFLMAAFLCANYVAMVLLFWMPNFLAEKFDLSLSL